MKLRAILAVITSIALSVPSTIALRHFCAPDWVPIVAAAGIGLVVGVVMTP